MLIISTGLSGLIGSRLQEILSSKLKFVDLSLESHIDILNYKQLETVFLENKTAEIVIHLAAFTDVDQAWLEKDNQNGRCFKVNVLGTKNIARLCQKNKKYLIHISTDYVFDGVKPIGEFYTEEDQPNPIEWYGETKLLAEKAVENSGCDYVILRTSFPFKASPSLKEKKIGNEFKLDFLRKIIKKLKEGEELKMFSDQIITPTFIDDLVFVIGKVIEKKPKGIYHAVGSEPLSPYNLARQIAKTFSLNKALIKEAKLSDLQNQARPRQKNLGLSNQKLEEDLEIKMKTFSEALKVIKNQGIEF